MSVPTEREAFYCENSGVSSTLKTSSAAKKPVDHLAFYTDGEIKTAVPRVTDAIESIELTEDSVRSHDGLTQSQRDQLLAAVEHFHSEVSERYGETEKVIFLRDGEELEHPVKNDKTASDSDRTVAFVQGHRYVSFSKLKQNPNYTSELEDTQ